MTPDLYRAALRLIAIVGIAMLAVGASRSLVSVGPVSAQSCLADLEPNDAPAMASSATDEVCVFGSLPDDDQDLLLWEITPDVGSTAWSVHVDGVAGTLTGLKFFPVTSPPGVPPVTPSTPILEVEAHADPESGRAEGVLLPIGRYVLAISRTPFLEEAARGSLDYAFRIERGPPLPPSAGPATGTTADLPLAGSGPFAVSGDLEGSDTLLAWGVGATDEHWRLDLRVPLGEQAWLELIDDQGQVVARVQGQTHVTLYDLHLPPSTYSVRVAPRADVTTPYVLSARSAPAVAQAEPNDETAVATPIAEGMLLRGRLAGRVDRDRFTLAVPSGPRMLRDVRARWRSGKDRTLCLLDAEGRDATCRTGSDGASLMNLSLAPGAHTFEMRGEEDLDDIYLLRIDATTPPAADFEAEPNETAATANAIEGLRIRGRGGARDEDVFRLTTTGEPQLWRVEVSGSELDALEWVTATRGTLARGSIDASSAAATLDDVYLVPGEHWFRVVSSGGEYELSLTGLGPPDPDGEREPNSESIHAERYRIGSRRVGRLPVATDIDMFRISLAGPQHVRFEIEPPTDGSIDVYLSRGRERIGDILGADVGETIRYDAWLEAGDYVIELRPTATSAGRYVLTSALLDPFALAADQEPNDHPHLASALPLGSTWEGIGHDDRDEDWYRIPPLAEGAELAITLENDRGSIRVTTADGPVPSRSTGDGVYATEGAPAGVPLRLSVLARGAYRVTVDGGGLPRGEVPPRLPVRMSLESPTDDVAAYWSEAQAFEATLTLTNDGSDPVEVGLETVTSHHLWRATPDVEVLTLPAGRSTSVPVAIEVQPDAWADEAVQVAIEARSAGGSTASAFATFEADRAAAPVAPRQAWSVPHELLGGIDAAAIALGGSPSGPSSGPAEPLLYDGYAVDGGGYRATDLGLPTELVIDLAGSDPVPVAGVILNPLTSRDSVSGRPREFELLLSDDGATWAPAFSGTLSPLPIDQPFVLARPIMATHGLLRVTGRHGDAFTGTSLGEFKVVLTPGASIGPDPFDIADPGLGGHVVSLEPYVAVTGDALIGTGADREFSYIDESRTFEVILGFREGRSALVDRLGWLDPIGSQADGRLDRVEVWSSTVGPTGPWESHGAWTLDRAVDGSVDGFAFPEPTWLRYLRVGGEVGDEAILIEYPASIRVFERAAGPGYRSVVGEWGYGDRRGPMEWLGLGRVPLPEPGEDAPDGPRMADVLEPDRVISDRVEFEADEDWFSVAIPDGHNTLDVVVEGRPTVGVSLEVFDDQGLQRPVAFSPQPDGSVLFQAAVDGGTRYDVAVRQPPFSAVFAFDTSPSIGAFVDTVVEGMRSFASDVRPGREAIMLLPFQEPALLADWEDDPYVLQDAVAKHGFDGGSSGAEAGLIDAARLLEDRPGARAILVVTDAETSTAESTANLWRSLGRVRPIIFSTHIGGTVDPGRSRSLMQDWAASGGGHYTYPTSQGEMDRAFDRMATWLRRPASYTLRHSTRDLAPSTLQVLAAEDGVSAGLAAGVGVEIVLDTSGSMLKRLGGVRRIDIARRALRDLVADALDDGTPVALRTFGGKGKKKRARCETRLSGKLAPLDKVAMLARVERISARKTTKTPIAGALSEVVSDLADVSGPKTIVLITDGAESCGGDPAAAIESLRASGFDVNLNIVGFALDDPAVKAEMAAWATAGDGSFFDAADPAELAASIATAVSAPFRVYGPDGEVFEGGTVGGDPLLIDPGTYRVEVLTDPPVEFSEVVVPAGAPVELELPAR